MVAIEPVVRLRLLRCPVRKPPPAATQGDVGVAATEDAARTSNMLGRTHQRAQEGTRRGGKSRGGGQASGGSLRACIRVPPSRSASPTQGLPSPFFCTRGDARTPDCSARRASSGAPGRARREVSTRLRRCMRAGVEVCSTWHGFPPPPTRSHVPYTQSTRRELRAVRHTVSTEACFSTWGMRRGRGGGAGGRVGHAQREMRGENPPPGLRHRCVPRYTQAWRSMRCRLWRSCAAPFSASFRLAISLASRSCSWPTACCISSSCRSCWALIREGGPEGWERSEEG